ncbi:MAG: hypothetical protein GY838_13030 [bacterium]|nr:hypothetical protein [bacterium]
MKCIQCGNGVHAELEPVWPGNHRCRDRDRCKELRKKGDVPCPHCGGAADDDLDGAVPDNMRCSVEGCVLHLHWIPRPAWIALSQRMTWLKEQAGKKEQG